MLRNYLRSNFSLLRILAYGRQALRSLFDLVHGTDVEGTSEAIRSGIDLRGYQTWILICSAMLASIGLNTNSAAVIIGAMLISPLMNPILGIGLGVGINDRELLIKGLVSLGLAVVASLGTSFIYFLLTPLSDPTPELLGRIKPSILDVGVAVFGGIAGIIAISREKQTNAIPGVAIATALMPPLCTAGYGLATAQWSFFFGAFYLFFINAVFISLSTYTIVRLLHFPYKEFVDANDKKVVKRWIAIFALVITIPSAVIFYSIISEYREKKLIESFIDSNFKNETQEVIRWESHVADSVRILKLYVVGDALSAEKRATLQHNLSESSIGDFQLKFVQMNVPKEERQRLASEITSSVLQTVAIQSRTQEESKRVIDSLSTVLTTQHSDTIAFASISSELKILFPKLITVSYGKMQTSNFASRDTIPVFLVEWEKRMRSTARKANNQKLREFLLQRSGLDTLQLVEAQP